MSLDDRDDGTQSRIITTPRSGRVGRTSTPGLGASGSALPAPPPPDHAQPAQIGRFSVLRLVGRGGMGAVYACYDDLLDRKVAVKVLRLDAVRDRDVAAARLVREGQTLARLSHPNVVTVHEVGQAADQVFVAMEFVRGDSLDVWAAKPRPWRETLAAFIQAGRGLEAAHRAGIIHRDFKPQNVIMSADGLVKVLDFGLARASGDEVRDEWLSTLVDGDMAASAPLMRPLTRTGTLVGTPAYMSPEQHRGDRVTAASDQFSFCVALYQCLYGLLPFSTRSFAELRDDVTQGRVLPAPSRSPVPARVFAALRRGMAADAAARYPTMGELLVALARDPGALQRRAVMLVMTAAVTGATGFAVASAQGPALEQCPDASAELVGIWDPARASSARDAVRATGSPQADAWVARALPQIERYAAGWTRLRDEACRAHAEGRQSAQLLDLRMACLDQRRAGLDALVDGLMTADAAGLDALARAAAELPPLERCADAEALLTALAPPDDPRVRARVQAHREALARARVLEDAGQLRRGLELVEGVLADVEAVAHEPLLAEAKLQRGRLLMGAGEPEAAASALQEALLAALAAGHGSVAAQASSWRGLLRAVHLGQLERARADLPEVAALHRRVQGDVELYAEFLHQSGYIHLVAGDRPEARRLLEAARDLRTEHGRDRSWKQLATRSALGTLAHFEGRLEEMAAIFGELRDASEALLGPTHAEHLRHEYLYAYALTRLGRPRAARARLARALARLPAVESQEARRGLLIAAALAALEDDDTRAARQHLADALPLVPPHSSDLLTIMGLLMRAAARDGDAEEVETHHRSAQAWLADPQHGGDANLAYLLWDRGRALEALGRTDEAIAALERMTSLLADPTLLPEPEVGPRARADLGRLRARLGELDAAELDLQQARRDLDQVWPVEGPVHADLRRELGELALARQRPDEAAQHLRAAVTRYAASVEPDHLALARTRFALARALAGSDPAGAREHAARAREAFHARGRAEELQALDAWLAGRE